MLRSTRQHLRLGAGVVAVVILLVPLVSLLTSGKATAGTPVASATVFATVRINTLEVSLAVPSSVGVGEKFEAVATLRNLGSTKIMRAKATIRLPALETGPAFTLRGQEDKNAGAILPGKDKRAKWNLVAEAPGTFFIMVTAVGTDETSGDLLEAEDTTMIVVVPGPALPHPEGTLPPSSGENGEGTVPPSDEEHEDGTAPPPGEEDGEGTVPPSGGERGEGGVIDKALSGLRSVRDFFATLISS